VLGIGGDQTPQHWQALRQQAAQPFALVSDYADADNYAAATETEAFFLGSDITFSEPIECSVYLGDDLIDLNDEQVNAALVELNTLDDVMLLAQYGSMSPLPLAVHTDSRTILEAALRYVQGRLIIDSNCQIDFELIERTAAKYGAIVY
jgi:5-methyltetrahydrofolate--homocysteine methyltransferase